MTQEYSDLRHVQDFRNARRDGLEKCLRLFEAPGLFRQFCQKDLGVICLAEELPVQPVLQMAADATAQGKEPDQDGYRSQRKEDIPQALVLAAKHRNDEVEDEDDGECDFN